MKRALYIRPWHNFALQEFVNLRLFVVQNSLCLSFFAMCLVDFKFGLMPRVCDMIHSCVCSVLQCVAVCCSVLQCVAVCCFHVCDMIHSCVSHDSFVCDTHMSHTHVTHTCHTHMSHTHVTHTCHTHKSHTHVTHTCHTHMSHKHVTHTCHTHMSHTHILMRDGTLDLE